MMDHGEEGEGVGKHCARETLTLYFPPPCQTHSNHIIHDPSTSQPPPTQKAKIPACIIRPLLRLL